MNINDIPVIKADSIHFNNLHVESKTPVHVDSVTNFRQWDWDTLHNMLFAYEKSPGKAQGQTFNEYTDSCMSANPQGFTQVYQYGSNVIIETRPYQYTSQANSASVNDMPLEQSHINLRPYTFIPTEMMLLVILCIFILGISIGRLSK